MATEAILRSITLEAAADLSGEQFFFVTTDTNGDAAAITDVADFAVGVLQNNPDTAGFECNVAVDGVTKLEAGTGGLTAGDLVTNDNAGAGVTATAGTNNVYGIALTTAAAGEVASVLLRGAIISATNA